jgi:hypothetical protein
MKELRMRSTTLVLAALLAVACGSDASGPSRPGMSGTYVLTTLTFDPQGVLPEVDLRAQLGAAVLPRLILAPGGEAQLVFEDPTTGLISTVNGSYSTPQAGVRVDFGTNTAYRDVFLSRRMTFTAASETSPLTFDGTAPDGVDRQRLVQLVPDFADEQLLDPVPGRLVVVFSRTQ